MTVGMSKNIEGNEVIAGIFTHRPTAGGAEVATGAAKVRSIKGNSVAWGQLVENPHSTVSCAANGYLTSINNITIGHKYYLRFTSILASSKGTDEIRVWGSSMQLRQSIEIGTNIYDNVLTISGTQNTLSLYYSAGNVSAGDASMKDINILDLTALNIDNLTTAAEVEAWLQANVGLQPYYAYNAGELLSANLLGIKTVGFNQWDEEWENGSLDVNTGAKVVGLPNVLSKNYIKVLANTEYCFHGYDDVYMCYYDSSYTIIGKRIHLISATTRTFTTPSGCCYIKFVTGSGYGTTYNHDICINLHYTNGKDGQYEPYVEHQYDFDVTKVYGKLNGEGSLVQVFPNGMKSAGSVRDVIDITKREAICATNSKIFDNNDPWGKSSDGVFYSSVNSEMKTFSNNINNKYIAGAPGDSTAAANGTDKTLRCDSDRRCILKDTSCADIEAAKTAMNGVEIIYELDTPLHYTDLVYRDNGVDTPLDALNILVDNYGTEEQIIESPTNGDPNSCAASIEAVYGLDAAAFIDGANNGGFISSASQDALLDTLGAALGGTLSAIWNSTTGKYDYSFTPNS